VSRLSESGNWFARTLILVAAVTAARLILLAFNRTDLFVDESQYWLWGQNLDFGYYSKPPLIGWVIRAVTDLAGSDSPFWVRAPGAILHAATALILAALASRLFGPRAAFWTGISYVTVPFATVGSLLMSTDTIMAPCYAAALYFWFALSETAARPLPFSLASPSARPSLPSTPPSTSCWGRLLPRSSSPPSGSAGAISRCSCWRSR
jgi:4-amino-4-deoxy-L-arabinose transferase-like glycosyltransferase